PGTARRRRLRAGRAGGQQDGQRSGEGGDAAGTPATAGEGLASPDGTQGTISAGPYILFTGSRPAVALGEALRTGERAPEPLEPPVDEGGEYSAAASAISPSGLVALYSVQESERRIRTFDAVTEAWDEVPVGDAPTTQAGLQLAFVGDRIVLYQADDEAPRLWVDGAGPFALPAAIGSDGLLQASGPASDAALVASSNGLYRLSLADGAELEHVEAAGEAARPVAFGEAWAAAWLASGSGQLWVSDGPGTAVSGALIDLAIDGDQFEDNVDVTPSLVSNGDRAVLLERSTGMLWSVPDGVLIPLRQWTADEVVPAPADNDVPDESPAPPVAVNDAFGVRAGQTAVLPVLYNDHDANPEDVLSIDPASVQGLDPAFGTLSFVGANQTLVIAVTGSMASASFTYRATDGKNPSAAPATVTLTLKGAEHTPPVWCDDYFAPDPCFVDWPQPQILLGGTATFDVLKGWVDAEGDALIIDSAVPEAGAPIVAMPSADGRLAIGHTDRTGAPGTYRVLVTVRDAYGDVSEPRELEVDVLASPDFSVKGGAILGRAGEWTTQPIAEFASGGSGSYQVLDVAELTVGGRLDLDWNEADGAIRLRAEEAGDYIVTAKVKDAATPNQHDVNLRYTVLPAEQDAVAVPPLTAYVRQGEDTLVDVLGAVQNTTGRVLLVTSATPGPAPNAGPTVLAASVIDHALIQLRSIDSVIADRLGRSDGPLGSVAYTVEDADGNVYRGSIGVFLVPASGQAPIAVPDAATVRAGDVAEVAVLANDVAPRGERLALHPDMSTSGDGDGLAFSAGTSLRYLAPEVPGTYTVFYYAYLESSPEQLARSQVTFTVLPPGANRAPQAIDLESRTLSGRTVEIPVPVDRMDPDGDRVLVTSVAQPAEPRLGAVMVGEGGRSLLFTAPETNRQLAGGAQQGGWQAEFTYTVRDSEGETGTATVRVAVSAQDPEDLAPVTFIDKVRVKQVEPGGAPVPISVEPLLNDRDPADGSLALGSPTASGLHILYEVAPNMSGRAPGGAVAPGSPYAEAQRLQVPPVPVTLADGTNEFYPDGAVGFQVTDETAPGTYYFLYTVESLKTRSTAEGVIAITVSPGDSPNQPVIEDTVVTAATRGQVESGGIDVLSGKVVWPTGDASGLRIAGFGPGAPSGFSFNGSRIEGRVPSGGAVVPFRVEYGTDATTGEPKSAWGLLRIPAFDDYRLQVVRLPDPVTELETGDIDLLHVLGVADDDRVEVSQTSSFATHRPSTNESLAVTACVLKPGSASVLSYTAGYSPGIGSDTCTVDVRLAGQSDDAWSTVVIPIPIKPKDPLAILTPVTKTVNILNGRIDVNLHDELVGWTGDFSMDDAGQRETMVFTASYGGGSFKVTPTGPDYDLSLAIDVSPTAASGARETVSIHLDYPWPSDPSLPHFQKDVALVLYVGQVPAQGPSGATLSKSCDAKSIDACQLQVVFPADQSGQFNPLTGNTSGESTALRLVGVGGGSGSFECPALGQATAQGESIRLALLTAEESKPAGGTCVVPFTVADVRGRTGSGQVSFDVTGFPPKPSAPVTADSGEGFVQVDVVLGDAARAHPAVNGVRLYEAGALVPNQSCERLDAGTFRCTVTGLDNAVHHIYQARAVNEQGDESALSGPLTTWAFVAPSFPPGGEPEYEDRIYEPGTTDTNHGRMRLESVCLQGNSAVAGEASSIRYAIGMPGNPAVTVPVDPGTGCTADQLVTVNGTGGFTITATPVSGAEPPPIGTSTESNEGSGTVSPGLVSHGAPSAAPTLTATWNGTDAVAVSWSPQWNSGDAGAAPDTGAFPQVSFIAWLADDPEPVCATTLNAGGFTELTVTGTHVAATGTASASFSVGGSGADLAVNDHYRFKACGTYGYGLAQSTQQVEWLFHKPAAPASSTMTYTPASEDMNDPSIHSWSGSATAPSFTWTLPSTDPVNNAGADLAAGAASLNANEPPPGASTWQVRYFYGTAGRPAKAPAGSPSAITNQPVSGNQFGSWYAQYCFNVAAEPDPFCSDWSAAITPTTQYTGVDFGTSATLTLPTQAQCQAFFDDVNNVTIPAAGQAAYDTWWNGYYGNVYSAGYTDVVDGTTHYPGYTEQYSASMATYYTPAAVAAETPNWQFDPIPPSYTAPYVTPTTGPSGNAEWDAAFAGYQAAYETASDGWNGQPLPDPMTDQWQYDRDAWAEDKANTVWAPAKADAVVLANAQAQSDTEAQDAGHAAQSAAAAQEAQIAAQPGAGDDLREQAIVAAGDQFEQNAALTSGLDPTTWTLGAFTPMSNVTHVLARDPGTHLFTSITYGFAAATSLSLPAMAYVKAAVTAQLGSSYACGA
ncbi:MAG: hypothetical protein J7480_04185, partial [Microbacteriaceae bacterium]|nr:hypothetical protein [Microbacteriaceae bacterium]